MTRAGTGQVEQNLAAGRTRSAAADEMSAQAWRRMAAGTPLAFASHVGTAAGTADDRLVIEALARRCGCTVGAVPWDDPAVDWRRFSGVVIRSTWDYHRRLPAFLAWLARLEELSVPLWNPAAAVRWNADKRYLQELAGDGVMVVPTAWIDRAAPVELKTVLAAHGWAWAVIKPSVSATGFRTWRSTADAAGGERRRLAALLRESDALVQPYLPEVEREGEWSFLFFAGADGRLRYSHAVLKRPARGDFRVQADFGGTVLRTSPPAPLVRQAESAAAAVERRVAVPLLYARIDGVASDGTHAAPGTLLVMEAELIEPMLFLAAAPAAAARFADAIVRHAGRVESGRP
jgi:glutathione synthase/RimK-type ligase-like ATP-grasp enzyme